MLIGLAGQKNSGKDTVGAYLVKEYGFERRSFADKLKESAAALFGVEPYQLDVWKNNEHAKVQLVIEDKFSEENLEILSDFRVRSMLQRYGTEAHRNVFGQDFWVDQLLPVEGFYAGRAIVVTDVRFLNEYQRILNLGGYVVIIDRPALDLKDQHSSERDWMEMVGYKIMNDGTINELYEKVESMLEDVMLA